MAAAPRGRRGAGCLTVLLVVLLLVLAGVVVGGNTYGRAYAEGAIATDLQQQGGLTVKPAVSIEDPVLAWSALRKKLDGVHIVAEGFPIVASGLSVPADVDVTLHGVRTRDYKNFTADVVDGTALIAWGPVQRLAGQPIADAGGGRVGFKKSVSLAGISVSATITAKPVIEAGALVLSDPAINIAGFQIPSATTRQLVATVISPIPLPLPGGLTASDVTVSVEGLSFHIVGVDVDLRELR